MLERFRRQHRPVGYAAQTYANPHWFVRVPHRMRYDAAAAALKSEPPPVVLDYGAGDGHLLVSLLTDGVETEAIVAYEPVETIRDQLVANLEKHGLADRVSVVSDRELLAGESFDVITCLGVLEHMPLPERAAFYDICDKTLRRDGRIFIDVPVEVGPSLLVKALTRWLLKGREQEYGLRTLLRLSLGGKAYDPERFDPTSESTWIHDHKGFDYRLFRAELAHRFTVVEEQRTPVPWLPAGLGNQEVYFHAVKRGLG